jgi:hypothetical protein
MKARQEITKVYTQIQIEIKAEIKELQNGLAIHNERAANIDWDDVKDITYILNKLQELNGCGCI